MEPSMLTEMLQRFLDSDEDEEEVVVVEGSHGDEDEGSKYFNVAIATIFAREFLEGAIIIGQYRTVIKRNDQWDAETKSRALTTVTRSAAFASMFAIAVVLAVAIPLGVLGNELDDTASTIIEGVSKVVASFCILQLSVKIPVWLGIYRKVSIFANCKSEETKATKKEGEGNSIEQAVSTLSFNELRFNVAWNIWREVAECGVFLIPFFLGSGAGAIPLSALVGIVVALFLGIGIYIANNRMQNKNWLASFMAGLTLFLAVGLFVGGCHEFEEVWGDTKEVWEIDNHFFSHKEFPFVFLKPFGYSSSRTVLQMTTFWLFLGLGLAYHFLKWNASKTLREADALAAAEQEEVIKKGGVITKVSQDTRSDDMNQEKADYSDVEEVEC